jgi:hypothetical protein
MNVASLISQMPPVVGVADLERRNAENSDIIEVIEKNFPEAVQQTKRIAPAFEGKNRKESAYNVWKFLRDHVNYKVDPKGKQWVRLPNQFLTDGKGDCKSLSLFAAAVLSNLGMSVTFRYASYNLFDSTPTHVYVVTKDEGGNAIIVDAVWPLFNSQKKSITQ